MFTRWFLELVLPIDPPPMQKNAVVLNEDKKTNNKTMKLEINSPEPVFTFRTLEW